MPLCRVTTVRSLSRRISTSAVSLADSQHLDFQQLASAGRLGDVAGGRELVAVEVPHDLPAGLDLPEVAEEDRLMDDRVPARLPRRATASMVRSASWACSLQIAAVARDGIGEHMPHAARVRRRRMLAPALEFMMDHWQVHWARSVVLVQAIVGWAGTVFAASSVAASPEPMACNSSSCDMVIGPETNSGTLYVFSHVS